ncbi:MAG: DUF58 domain-containing protein [Armatimonadetes bacterium]|nr:DUF58 domain-containing protein [Anaerolineae bacterium]
MTTIDAETMRRIRRIELKTRRLVQANLVGAYQALFKGRGMAFDAVRPYEPGDDVRDIDWNVTARSGGEPFVKRYTEERELTVLLVLDASASCFFGTTGQQKQALAAELSAALALAAIRNNDRVGLLVFSAGIEQFTPPRRGRNHILRLIRDVLVVQPTGTGTNLALALKTANNLLKQRAIVFVISDFLAAKEDYTTELLVISRKHDVIALVLTDPREQTWDAAGLLTLRDAETDALAWVDTDSAAWRTAFAARAARFAAMRDAALTRAGVARLALSTDSDYLTALVQFFQRRR